MYSSKSFGENLRNHLTSHGISQKWVAEKMGTTGATISRYVSGGRIPGVESLVDLSEVLGLPVDVLLGVDKPDVTERRPDLSILRDCYEKAPDSIKKIVWSALDQYMTPAQRIVIEASMAAGKTKPCNP